MGVTDVDDKIIKKAKDSGKREAEVAAKYELQFFNALEKLNVRWENSDESRTQDFFNSRKWFFVDQIS